METENLRAVGLRNKMAAMHEVRHGQWWKQPHPFAFLRVASLSLNISMMSEPAAFPVKLLPCKLQLSRWYHLHVQERRQKQQELRQQLKEKQQELDRYKVPDYVHGQLRGNQQHYCVAVCPRLVSTCRD